MFLSGAVLINKGESREWQESGDLHVCLQLYHALDREIPKTYSYPTKEMMLNSPCPNIAKEIRKIEVNRGNAFISWMHECISTFRTWTNLILCLQRQINGPPIEHPRKVAASFAIAVTARALAGNGWIAKNDDLSLFGVLQRVLPQVRDWFSNIDQAMQEDRRKSTKT